MARNEAEMYELTPRERRALYWENTGPVNRRILVIGYRASEAMLQAHIKELEREEIDGEVTKYLA